MIVATQPRGRGRLATLDPFELGKQRCAPGSDEDAAPRTAASRGEHEAHPPEVGCVDWYMYPVSRKPARVQR